MAETPLTKEYFWRPAVNLLTGSSDKVEVMKYLRNQANAAAVAIPIPTPAQTTVYAVGDSTSGTYMTP